MQFGERIRGLRKARNLSQRELGAKTGVSFTYISKIENGKLDFSDYPSEALIQKMGVVLDTDINELLLLAQKIPGRIRRRVFERPDVFLKVAELDNATCDHLLEWLKEG